MKTVISPVQTGQHHPKTVKYQSQFQIFQHGDLIASSLNGYAAIGLKRMFPNITVKFSGMIKAGV
jgi:hypothetical protein